jgi:hypothetical protein
MTAALCSYSFLRLPYMVGPALFASIVYWMAGTFCAQSEEAISISSVATNQSNRPDAFTTVW